MGAGFQTTFRNEIEVEQTGQLLIPSKLSYSVSELTSLLANEKYFSSLDERTKQNERNKEKHFEGFSDLEMIYYYSYLSKDVEKNKERNPETKKTYIRELIAFYKNIKENEPYLRADVNQLEEPSLFKILRVRHMKDYLSWLTEEKLGRGNKPYSVATRSKKIAIIKSFLKWIYEVGFLKENITIGLPSSKVDNDDRPSRDLSFNEVSQIIEFYKKHLINHTLLSILATTGLRISELANSKMQDLYFDSFRGEYWLKVNGKGNKKREVLIFNNVYERIMTFRKRRGLSTELNAKDKAPFLTTKKGGAYNSKYLSGYISNIIKKTALPFLEERDSNITSHFFRHFFAIYSAQKGAPIYYISRSLGHESIKTTEIYLEKHTDKENNAAHVWEQSKF